MTNSQRMRAHGRKAPGPPPTASCASGGALILQGAYTEKEPGSFRGGVEVFGAKDQPSFRERCLLPLYAHVSYPLEGQPLAYPAVQKSGAAANVAVAAMPSLVVELTYDRKGSAKAWCGSPAAGSAFIAKASLAAGA